jgi:hypothetical protein
MLKARGGSMVLFLLGSIDQSGAPPVLDPQILWHDGHVRIDNFLKNVPEGHWIHVRGEDVVAETDKTLARICRWLGISDSVDALDAMRHPEESPFSHVGPANARLGNDINFLESPKLNPGKGKALSLEGPLEWRDDGACFHPWVQAIAGEFGYH